MRPLRSLSDSFRRLSRRERTVVSAGAAVSAAALAVSFLVLPLADRWETREAVHRASRAQWIRLQALVASEDRLRRALDQQRRAQRTSAEVLLTGATPTLAASNLQVLLQQYAEESMVELSRVDVAGEPKAARPGLLAIPVVLQGKGDVYGLVDFLDRVQHGERLLVVEELTVNARAAWMGDAGVLTWSLRAHGLYSTSEGST